MEQHTDNNRERENVNPLDWVNLNEKKLKKSLLIKSPFIKKTPKVSPSKSA